MIYLSAAIISYLLGSISPSILIGKLLKGIDIREHGSGNAGSTNSFRVLGKTAGISVLLLDITKGFLAIQTGKVLSYQTTPEISLLVLCGISVIMGHILTVFHSFRGGKGVNTATGVMLGLLPMETLLSALVFLIVLRVSGYVSLGAITASCSLPLFLILDTITLKKTMNYELLGLASVIPLVIILTHIPNIKRLLSGHENQVGFGKKKS